VSQLNGGVSTPLEGVLLLYTSSPTNINRNPKVAPISECQEHHCQDLTSEKLDANTKM